MHGRPRRGFTLVEMLIVVLIIGLIMGIGIPNLLNAIQRAKQKRTLGDMAGIATAVESYSLDYNAYPPAGAGAIPVTYGGLSYPSVTLGVKAVNYVAPTYLKVVPLIDGWNSWFMFTSQTQDYAIVSGGKDGTLSMPNGAGPTSSFNADIVFSDGQFTVYPEGVQE